MKKCYSNEVKASVVKRSESGESVKTISEKTNIPRSTIYQWLSEIKNDVTCYRFKEKTYYICVALDLFSRMVVG